MNGAAFCRSISDEDDNKRLDKSISIKIGLSDGTLDLKPIFELMEQYCSNAIWNIETNPLYFEESIEYLKNLATL